MEIHDEFKSAEIAPPVGAGPVDRSGQIPKTIPASHGPATPVDEMMKTAIATGKRGLMAIVPQFKQGAFAQHTLELGAGLSRLGSQESKSEDLSAQVQEMKELHKLTVLRMRQEGAGTVLP